MSTAEWRMMIPPQVRRLKNLTADVSSADVGGSTAGVGQSRVGCGPALTANQEPLQHSPSSVAVAKRTMAILKGCCRCAGLTRSMVTVSCPLGRRMVIVFSPLLMTGKGPSSGGQRGGFGCFLMKTCEQSWSPGGM